jgi:hypothetical protein
MMFPREGQPSRRICRATASCWGATSLPCQEGHKEDCEGSQPFEEAAACCGLVGGLSINISGTEVDMTPAGHSAAMLAVADARALA